MTDIHPIPPDALDDRLGFVGTSGSGKTYAAGEAARSGTELTREELASRSGYAAGSGGFNNLIGALCRLDIFVKPRPGSVAMSAWMRDLLG